MVLLAQRHRQNCKKYLEIRSPFLGEIIKRRGWGFVRTVKSIPETGPVMVAWSDKFKKDFEATPEI